MGHFPKQNGSPGPLFGALAVSWNIGRRACLARAADLPPRAQNPRGHRAAAAPLRRYRDATLPSFSRDVALSCVPQRAGATPWRSRPTATLLADAMRRPRGAPGKSPSRASSLVCAGRSSCNRNSTKAPTSRSAKTVELAGPPLGGADRRYRKSSLGAAPVTRVRLIAGIAKRDEWRRPRESSYGHANPASRDRGFFGNARRCVETGLPLKIHAAASELSGVLATTRPHGKNEKTLNPKKTGLGGALAGVGLETRTRSRNRATPNTVQ